MPNPASPSPASPVSMELPEEIALAIEDFSSADRAEARASARAPEGEFAHLVKETDARYSALTAAILSRLREAEAGREEALRERDDARCVGEATARAADANLAAVEACEAARDAALARVERLESVLREVVLRNRAAWPAETRAERMEDAARSAISEAPPQGDQ